MSDFNPLISHGTKKKKKKHSRFITSLNGIKFDVGSPLLVIYTISPFFPDHCSLHLPFLSPAPPLPAAGGGFQQRVSSQRVKLLSDQRPPTPNTPTCSDCRGKSQRTHTHTYPEQHSEKERAGIQGMRKKKKKTGSAKEN